MSRLLLLLCLLVATDLCFCQSQKADSLKLQLKRTSNKKARILITLELSENLMRDNLFEALEFSNQAIRDAQALKNDSLLMASYLGEGKIYIQLGNYPRAMQLVQQVIQGTQNISSTGLR